MNTLGSNQYDIMIPLEDAFLRLRSYSEKREDRIKLIKIGKLTVYFELSPEIVLKVPLPYWQAKGMRNFKFSDPDSDRADRIFVSKILPYYVNILDRAKRALEASDLTALRQIPEIEFWSLQFVENGDIQPDWKGRQHGA